jgi:hypothetical protein
VLTQFLRLLPGKKPGIRQITYQPDLVVRRHTLPTATGPQNAQVGLASPGAKCDTLRMTVTYIRRSATVGGPGAGTGGAGAGTGGAVRPGGRTDTAKGAAFRRICRPCGTVYVIDVGRTRLRIDVTGPSCNHCDPIAYERRDSSLIYRDASTPLRPERIFKVWLASQDRAAPRIEVRDIPFGGTIARPISHKISQAIDISDLLTGDTLAEEDGVSESGTVRRSQWSTELKAKLGPQAWEILQSAWTENHCGTIASLAEALDAIWVAVRAGASVAYRVIIRLHGMPQIVHALATEIAARSTAAHYGPPLHIIAEDFRRIGVAACAATDVNTCVSLGFIADQIKSHQERASINLDWRVIQRAFDQLEIPAAWNGRKMPSFEDHFQALVSPPTLSDPSSGQIPEQAAAANRLELSIANIREIRELDAVTRPLAFGEKNE